MITTVTLNVAIDKRYTVEKLVSGTVMRVQECTYTAGGKGLNVSRVATILGEAVLATGIVGGHAGAYVESQLSGQNIKSDFVHVNGESRSCINIYDESTGQSTEFLEPGVTVSQSEVEQMLQKYEQAIAAADVVTISGSVPKGCGTDIYPKMIQLAKQKGKKVILDTSGPLLAEGIKALPTMIKPNADEIKMLTGKDISDLNSIICAAQQLHKAGIAYVVVSMGKQGAVVVCNAGVFQGTPPDVQVVNTVGCGDSMVAAFAVGFARGYEIQRILKFANAVSSANAMTKETGSLKISDLSAIIDGGTVQKISL